MKNQNQAFRELAKHILLMDHLRQEAPNHLGASACLAVEMGESELDEEHLQKIQYTLSIYAERATVD